MMTDAVGDRFKVTGINKAIAAAEPIPGRTPIAWPKTHPKIRKRKFSGWKTA